MMSSQSRVKRSRAEVLDELAQVGSEHSEAVVLFHSSIAQNMGLDPSAYKTLFLLRRQGPLSAGELSKETGLATASVTDLIDRLVTKGYIVRETDAKDRRRIVVTIVEQAITAARRHFGLPNPSLARLYDRYNVQELEVIADFLHRNAKRLRQELSLL